MYPPVWLNPASLTFSVIVAGLRRGHGVDQPPTSFESVRTGVELGSLNCTCGSNAVVAVSPSATTRVCPAVTSIVYVSTWLLVVILPVTLKPGVRAANRRRGSSRSTSHATPRSGF